MQVEPLVVTIGIFIATQVGTLIWTLAGQRWQSAMTRQEVKSLKTDVTEVQKEIKKLGDVLISMADMRGEINLLSARMLAQGQRLDEEISRSNTLRDMLMNNQAMKD